jgi:hypothetical protein
VARGVSPPATSSFDVELRSQGDRAFWRFGNAPSAVTGTRSAEVYRFVSARPISLMVDALGVAGCTLEQVETLDVEVRRPSDGGAPVADASLAAQDAGSPDAAPGDAGSRPGGPIVAPDAGPSPAPGMTGLSTLVLREVDGPRCAELLAAAGGPFPALPCEVRYGLFGVRR